MAMHDTKHINNKGCLLVPEWAKGAVLYQIFPDRFCRYGENVISEEEKSEREGWPETLKKSWNDPVSVPDYYAFYGGNLDGVTAHLDHIQSLGTEVIYLNPVFESPSSHGYDIVDYEHISTRLGGDEAFEKLTSEIHKRGMKIILDGVFNHCSILHRWVTENPEFFHMKADGSLESWWDLETLPKLNYEESEKLQEEILKIAVKWLKPPYSIDGWRLDVAADLGHSPIYNHLFWKKFRRAVKNVNPEALIVAEHYGNPSEWLKGDEWDTVMNYDGFMEPVSWFLTGMEKHSDLACPWRRGDGAGFRSAIDETLQQKPWNADLAAMNELDNHDHSRFLTRTSGRVGRLQTDGSEAAAWGVRESVLRQGVLMLATMPGMMGIYYGDEAGLCGWTDPDNRRPYPWDSENESVLAWFRGMAALRKRKDVRTGSLVWLAAQQDLIAYARVRKTGKTRRNDGSCEPDVTVTVIYTGQEECTKLIPLDDTGLRDGDIIFRTALTDVYGYDLGIYKIIVENMRLELNLKPDDGFIFSNHANPVLP